MKILFFQIASLTECAKLRKNSRRPEIRYVITFSQEVFMAGVLLHLAMGEAEKMDPHAIAYSASYKKAYTVGLLLPDTAKQRLIRNEDDFNQVFESCDEADILSYEEYLQFAKNNHFSPDPRNPAQQDTRNPDLLAYINTSYVDLQKPLWQGVLCHLMADKAFYYKSYCADDARALKDFENEVGKYEVWDGRKWRKSKTGQTYYGDYDVLNKRIENEYHVLQKTAHYFSKDSFELMLKCFHVGFSDERDEPVYMNLENIRKYIARSRQLMREIDRGNIEDALACFNEGRLDCLFE